MKLICYLKKQQHDLKVIRIDLTLDLHKKEPTIPEISVEEFPEKNLEVDIQLPVLSSTVEPPVPPKPLCPPIDMAPVCKITHPLSSQISWNTRMPFSYAKYPQILGDPSLGKNKF